MRLQKRRGCRSELFFVKSLTLNIDELIFNTRRIGKVNMYKLNVDLEAVGFLEKFSLEMSQIASREMDSYKPPLTERESKLLEELDSFSDNVMHHS